ncbi:FecR family protein [Methylophilus rhizosphaerae]|uniref:FecR family protein n=1 Tax=Methylophilus rhizosphaerae TaxID=492660 RepID=A0A1G9CQI4_9PROT|nr:FecR domain-containing protein [Methylophilus rhizosphaerae]SDK53858.1 FecR family protein [Methylophilus rhizosphaerae]
MLKALHSPSPDEVNAIRQAATWYSILSSESAKPSDREAWESWRTENVLHEQAWLEVEAVKAQFSKVNNEISSSVLNNAPSKSRRTILRGLVVLMSVGSAGLLSYKIAPWEEWTADYHTATGERMDIKLADGSILSINTRTSVDVIFDESHRRVKLHSGEIFITTSPDPNKISRPFIVETNHGEILALGTRFNVVVSSHKSSVSVFEKAVRVKPRSSSSLGVVLNAGQTIDFTSNSFSQAQRYNPLSISWKSGSLTVIDMPLGELVEELSRYRPGILRCEEKIALLKVSGTFPIDDTDRALLAIKNALPVNIVSRTRYWITIVSITA